MELSLFCTKIIINNGDNSLFPLTYQSNSWSTNCNSLPISYIHDYPQLMIWTGKVNTLRPRQDGRHFADDMFKCIFLNENVWILIEISLKFVSKGSINNNPALFQIMVRRRPGDKPLSEPMMVSSLTHICVTRPQRVKTGKIPQLHKLCLFTPMRPPPV